MRAWWMLVRFGFRLLYNELAWTYDVVSWLVSLGDWRGWQRAVIPYLQVPAGARVLELAHGTGNLQRDLAAEGLYPFGVDLSRAMGRIARRKLLHDRLQPGLVRCRAERLPFASASFPALVSTFPTEFIIHPLTLSEAYRVLQPGGRLVIVASGLLTGGGVLRVVLEWAYRVTGQRGPWPAGLAQRFTTAGFTLQQETVRFARSEAVLLIAHKD